MADDVLVEREGHLARVVLNRPDRLNALSAAMMEGLRAVWRELAADRQLRCVVVTGAGRGFCAGADLDLLASDRADARRTAADELSFLPGDRLDVPVIVAVNGVCAGAGLHFVADADIAIAAEGATFVDPHVSVGHVAGLEPVSLLLRARADVVRRMMLLGLGERIDAAAARAAGLVSEVVAGDDLAARADELAGLVAAGSPTAVAISRRVLRDAERALLGDHLERGWRAIRAHWGHPDSVEGPAARQEKRSPTWAPRQELR